METEYTYLLHLMGAYLRRETPSPADQADWDKLISLAQVHGVAGIVGYMGMNYALCQDPKRSVSFRSLCLSTMALYARRHAMALALIQDLEKAGIDHILMKGFVLRDYYPVPELRTFTDIDILIRQSDRARTHELMLSLGYTVKDDWEPVFSYYRADEYYEIHTQLMEIDVSEKADFRGYFSAPWSHAQPESGCSYRFTPEFHFLYMLTHIAKHIHGSGAGLRMYLDLAAFIRHHGAGLDWPWIEAQLRALALYDFARVALSAAERWFGILSPISFPPVPEDILNDFTEFTLEAGVFGHHNRNEALAKMKHQPRDDSASRAKLLLRQAFPKAQTIQSRYTYLQAKPWLLPVAWVHRFIKTGADTGKHLEVARQIIRADMEEVDRLKKLTRDIGL